MMNKQNDRCLAVVLCCEGFLKMKLRLYKHTTDFERIASWVTDARTHALWCANRMAYPVSAAELKQLLENDVHEWGGKAYVAVDDGGILVGFLVCSANEETRTAFLKFVLVNPHKRGTGVGTQMIRLITHLAFDEMKMERVKLNVFGVNTAAVRCYEKAGFVVESVDEGAFTVDREVWDRVHMVMEPGDSELNLR